MPNPREYQTQQKSPAMEAMLEKITGGQQNSLAGEIAALRTEIAGLRAALVPVPSLIITGQQVLDEFKRLTGVIDGQ